MVASACRDHTARAFLLGELHHAVVGTTQLEGKDRLEVFPFQPHVIVQPAAEIAG